MSSDSKQRSATERKSAIKKRHEQAANEVLPDRRDLQSLYDDAQATGEEVTVNVTLNNTVGSQQNFSTRVYKSDSAVADANNTTVSRSPTANVTRS